MGGLFHATEFQQIAPAVSLSLIAFLGTTSQVLFRYIDPHPLELGQTLRFNGLIFCLVVCYLRTWLMDPGRIPRDWATAASEPSTTDGLCSDDLELRRRWCRRCEMIKPPRAHHCKSCKRLGSRPLSFAGCCF